jgi:hypothetical protein
MEWKQDSMKSLFPGYCPGSLGSGILGSQRSSNGCTSLIPGVWNLSQPPNEIYLWVGQEPPLLTCFLFFLYMTQCRSQRSA